MPRPPHPPLADLETLAALFYPTLDDLGQFTEVAAAELPPVYRHLLAHEEHMTVTVEEYYGSRVDVEVVAKRREQSHYSRKILLRRKDDQTVVQYGIVRIDLSVLEKPVQEEILSESAPLGSILIRYDVLRKVRLLSLWQVETGPDLNQLFGLPSSEQTYGRTAVIDCNNEPAIELIEIVREKLGNG